MDPGLGVNKLRRKTCNVACVATCDCCEKGQILRMNIFVKKLGPCFSGFYGFEGLFMDSCILSYKKGVYSLIGRFGLKQLGGIRVQIPLVPKMLSTNLALRGTCKASGVRTSKNNRYVC